MPLLPLLEEDDDEPLDRLPDEPLETALPREPAEVDPALRLAVPEDELVTDDTLLPAEAELTEPAAVAALLVAALTRALASAADLLVAATPPPVPDDCPETDDRAACNAVLREADCEPATVDGPVLLADGGAE